MTEIQQATCEAFLARSYQFYDAVVRGVVVDFETRPTSCDLKIDAQDAESPSGWSRVVLSISGVTSFRFEVGRTTFAVLSSGVQLAWRPDGILLILDAYPDDVGLPDLNSNHAFVVGRTIRSSSEPLPTGGG